jgi:hypothetical protein
MATDPWKGRWRNAWPSRSFFPTGGFRGVKALWTYFVQTIRGPFPGGWAPLFRGRTLSRRILAPSFPALLLSPSSSADSVILGSPPDRPQHPPGHDVRSPKHRPHVRRFFSTAGQRSGFLSETTLISDYNKNQGFGLGQEAAVYRRELGKVF